LGWHGPLPASKYALEHHLRRPSKYVEQPNKVVKIQCRKWLLKEMFWVVSRRTTLTRRYFSTVDIDWDITTSHFTKLYSVAGRVAALTSDAESTSTSGTANHRIGPSTLRPCRTCLRYHRSRHREIADKRRWQAQSTTSPHSCHTSRGHCSADTILYTQFTQRTLQFMLHCVNVPLAIMSTDSLFAITIAFVYKLCNCTALRTATNSKF